jgi:replicative DNA helicase
MNPEIAQYEALFKEGLRRCMAEDEPADLHAWATAQLARMGGGDESAVLTWPESFDFYDALLAKRERMAHLPPAERKLLDWPWATWNTLLDPLEPGMLCVITAPDGQGKTIYSEMLAEHWASHAHPVVFVHYELNRALMMDRRAARWTKFTTRMLKSGQLNDLEKAEVQRIRRLLLSWAGNISYVHTPGWSMERTVAELRRLHAEGQCDVVILDYLEKAAASKRQLQMFGTNTWQREADNVEQLKTFAEATEIPVVMVAQMSKAGKSVSADRMDRTDMRGAGEKSEKANVVILLKRERIGEGYSNDVDVVIDKNTMGPTGAFKQTMVPEFFSVGDKA